MKRIQRISTNEIIAFFAQTKYNNLSLYFRVVVQQETKKTVAEVSSGSFQPPMYGSQVSPEGPPLEARIRI